MAPTSSSLHGPRVSTHAPLSSTGRNEFIKRIFNVERRLPPQKLSPFEVILLGQFPVLSSIASYLDTRDLLVLGLVSSSIRGLIYSSPTLWKSINFCHPINPQLIASIEKQSRIRGQWSGGCTRGYARPVFCDVLLEDVIPLSLLRVLILDGCAVSAETVFKILNATTSTLVLASLRFCKELRPEELKEYLVAKKELFDSGDNSHTWALKTLRLWGVGATFIDRRWLYLDQATNVLRLLSAMGIETDVKESCPDCRYSRATFVGRACHLCSMTEQNVYCRGCEIRRVCIGCLRFVCRSCDPRRRTMRHDCGWCGKFRAYCEECRGKHSCEECGKYVCPDTHGFGEGEPGDGFLLRCKICQKGNRCASCLGITNDCAGCACLVCEKCRTTQLCEECESWWCADCHAKFAQENGPSGKQSTCKEESSGEDSDEKRCTQCQKPWRNVECLRRWTLLREQGEPGTLGIILERMHDGSQAFQSSSEEAEGDAGNLSEEDSN